MVEVQKTEEQQQEERRKTRKITITIVLLIGAVILILFIRSITKSSWFYGAAILAAVIAALYLLRQNREPDIYELVALINRKELKGVDGYGRQFNLSLDPDRYEVINNPRGSKWYDIYFRLENSFILFTYNSDSRKIQQKQFITIYDSSNDFLRNEVLKLAESKDLAERRKLLRREGILDVV